MNIPQNGRIAIIDDNINQAFPIMEICGKHQFPYVYYNGQLQGLPEEGEAKNDIRLLFLDIYLTGDQIRTEKEIKSSLIPVLNRVISDKNYPYLLIFWSRHDNEHGKIIEDIFQNELKHKAPISFLSLKKSDYFDLTGEQTVDFAEKVQQLFSNINDAVNKYPIYGHLLAWENLIHQSADNTLEEIFKITQTGENWDINSNYLFYKLASSYTGKNFNSIPELDKIKSGFYTLNLILNDSLEYSIATKLNVETPTLVKPKGDYDTSTIHVINKKLLFVTEREDKVSPGVVSLTKNDKHNYAGILTSAIVRSNLFAEKKRLFSRRLRGVAEENLVKETKKIEQEVFDQFKGQVKSTWIPVEVNITPICDYVQLKEEYSRILPGILIENKFKSYIDTRTEALFLSPDFKLNLDIEPKVDGTYFLLLDFRYFTSIKKAMLKTTMTPILRIRQQLQTEIQSKLARHINRQGILFLE